MDSTGLWGPGGVTSMHLSEGGGGRVVFRAFSDHHHPRVLGGWVVVVPLPPRFDAWATFGEVSWNGGGSGGFQPLWFLSGGGPVVFGESDIPWPRVKIGWSGGFQEFWDSLPRGSRDGAHAS